MFYDSLTVEQHYDFEMPIKSDIHHIAIDSLTGEQKGIRQPRINHRGSYSTKIDITLRDNSLTISGNPSRYNRQDNLFGLTLVDDCIDVYNDILDSLDLPLLSKCTKTYHRQSDDGLKVQTISDGAMIKRIDMTTNRAAGKFCELDYIRACSTLPYKRHKGHLYPNGNTCDWLNKNGKAGNREYCKLYGKAFEMDLHIIPKVKREFGINSEEYKYVTQVRDYCFENGVVRFEQELMSEYLRENNFRYYGLFNEDDLKIKHEDFMNIDKKLQVSKMDIEHVNDTLLREGICHSTLAANTTASYFYRWMNGEHFDFMKSSFKTHASRLNKIGIDIRVPFDVSRHSPVVVRQAKIITPTNLLIPSWYKRPQTKIALVA